MKLSTSEGSSLTEKEARKKIENRIDIMSTSGMTVEVLRDSGAHVPSNANGLSRAKWKNGKRVVSSDFIEDSETFIVEYQGRIYDIREFLSYHPGGKKTLGFYKERSLDRVLREYPHSTAAFHLFEEYALDNKRKYGELESLVNWKAPLLSQVSKLGDRYWEWVNLPVNRPIRLFQSNILEFLTITPWYLVPIVWIPICIYFLYSGYSLIDIHSLNVFSLLEGLVSFVAGVLLWTIVEYLLHRKLFHFRPPRDSKILITLHFLLHGLHHKAPFDGQRLVFPPIAGILVAVGIWNIYEAIFPASLVNFIAAGTTAGYLCYDLMHYYLHYGAPKAETYLYDMKRNHNHHHFSHHDKGFGISSKIWDYVFNTSVCLRQLAKPIEW